MGYSYAKTMTRGINLGGWFVLEPFITPSLFEVFSNTTNSTDANVPIDEYHYTKKLGKTESSKRLKKHWDTWITEDDFKKVSGYGFNLVKIPIGYWAFEIVDDDPFVQGQIEYLDKAIEWAKNSDLKVWIDIHGHRGSQNGYDNSGLRDEYNWKGSNMTLSLNVTQQIAEKYGASDYQDTVIGIELVNEPLPTKYSINDIQDYYQSAYMAVRNETKNTPVIIHDAFQQLHFWDDSDFSSRNKKKVVLDHHKYQCFSVGELKLSADDHVSAACAFGKQLNGESLTPITSEWSGAMTDCTKWLNGVGRGARYDKTYSNNKTYIGSCEGINDISRWSDSKKNGTRRFIEAQMDAYEQGRGWVFWTYKTENASEWSVETLIENGLFPQPLTDRQHPDQCKTYFNGVGVNCMPFFSSYSGNELAIFFLVYIIIIHRFFGSL